MRHVVVLVRKEWEEVFRQRLVLGTIGFLPVVLVLLALLTIGSTASVPPDPAFDGPVDPELIRMMGERCAGLTGRTCMQVYLGTLYLLVFLVMPLALPSTFAAYSIVGEKSARTLEPLLATPVSTPALLGAKVVAAVLPAIVATWAATVAYVAGVFAIAGPEVGRFLVAPEWALSTFVLGPLLSVLAALVAVMVSSRATDPRVAQQVSSVVVLPIVMLIVGQSLGVLILQPWLLGIAIAAVGLADVLLGWGAVVVFRREAILTRWK